jgi:hypothetical protein
MTKKLSITTAEASFVDDIVNGFDLLEAYRRNYTNGYNDAKARHAAKQILKREKIQDRMQQMILDRQDGLSLDEAFVIDNLKRIVKDKPGSTQAVRALELLGKKMGMWIDKQVIEEVSSHRDIATQMIERVQARERGEEVVPLEVIEEETTAEIIEFEIRDGTDG